MKTNTQQNTIRLWQCRKGHTNSYLSTGERERRVCRICRRARHIRRINRDRFGGNRELVILRDKEQCLKCGMSREEHKKLFGLDITVDHIDGLGINTSKEFRNNKLENLQTLCLPCHGKKDGQRIKVPIVSI